MLKKISILIFIQIGLFILSFFLNSYMVDKMGKILYGHINLAFMIIQYLSPVLLLGSYSIILIVFPELIKNKKKAELQKVLSWTQRRLILTALLTFLIFLISIILQFTNLIPCHTIFCNHSIAFYIDALYTIPIFIFIFWNSKVFYVTNKEMFSSLLAADVTRGALIPCFCIAIFNFTQITDKVKINYNTSFYLFFITQIILIIAQYSIMLTNKKQLLNCKIFGNLWKKNDNPNLKKISKIHIPYDILNAIMCTSVATTLEYATPFSGELSKFFICKVISYFSTIIPGSLSPFMYGYFSKVGENQEDTEKLEKLLKINLLGCMLSFLISVVFLFLFYTQILKLYGIEKSSTISIGIIIACLYQILKKITVRPQLILNYKNMVYPAYQSMSVQIIIQVLGTYILSSYLGFLGAFIAACLGNVASLIPCYIAFKRKKIKIKPLGYF